MREDIQRLLISDVRESIVSYLEHRTPSYPPAAHPILEEPLGAFVTLKRSGQLRGCIGHIEGKQALRKAIQDLGRSSAFHDPRFPPLERGELDDLSIEISVLSPMSEISGPDDFRTGIDGILIEADGRSAVFLPQVAEEQGWDRDTCLSHLCIKAGLPSDRWKAPACRFFSFQADYFS